MKEITYSHRFTAPAEPERVFPLLCPVLEYRWIPHWRCEMLHSVSGVAEEDCVFRTDFPDVGSMTWIVSRYEPPTRIEFSCVAPERCVMRLKIALAADGAGTRLTWTRRFLSLGPDGDAWLDTQSEAGEKNRMDSLTGMLDHFLRTGAMLRT